MASTKPYEAVTPLLPGIVPENRGCLSRRSLFAPDVLYVEGGAQKQYEGIDRAARFFRFMYSFAADSRIEFVNLYGDEFGFGSEWIWSGMTQGPLLVDGVSYPPTNFPFTVDGAAVFKVNAEDLVTHHKDYSYSMRSLMQQLGLA